MSRRFSEIVPQSPLELERFYLDSIEKLKGTTATLDDLDQRSSWPGASISGELEREISSVIKSLTVSLRAQIDDIERIVRGLQSSSMATRLDDLERQVRGQQSFSLSCKISELERRIDSIEKSARF